MTPLTYPDESTGYGKARNALLAVEPFIQGSLGK